MPAKRSTDDAWCILRTSGRTTLRLATTLAEDGFAVWTPIETRKVSIPRANVKRDVTLPIMPSYVFAKAVQLIDLLRLAEMKVKPRRKQPTFDEDGKREPLPGHVDFSVMRYGVEGFPLVNDASLQSLRRLEAKRTPKKKADRIFGPGVAVTVAIEGGCFAGMKGKVEKSDERHTLVCFDDRMVVEIDTCLLGENALWDASSQMRDAA